MKPILVSIQKRDILPKIKERDDCNHRNTLQYFEDYNLSVTQRLVKMAVYGWTLVNNLKQVQSQTTHFP